MMCNLVLIAQHDVSGGKALQLSDQAAEDTAVRHVSGISYVTERTCQAAVHGTSKPRPPQSLFVTVCNAFVTGLLLTSSTQQTTCQTAGGSIGV
jgi:hypothetical protein